MGPQLHRCGKYMTDGVWNAGRDSLQWGRNFIVAERFRMKLPSSLSTRLQWGRNFIVAESQDRRMRRFQIHKLQWGRNFIVAESAAWKDGTDIPW